MAWRFILPLNLIENSPLSSVSLNLSLFTCFTE
uniref:Uncharacterized protein n=1 Tax=Nelumbo nucifera TaxID=4432 RepID=A0A822Y9Y0_NELNU|nr:TPA_asm: hypothetical protein HUJ06_027856 [Nelumbo nucifera]